jgi:NAD+ diphosphatase
MHDERYRYCPTCRTPLRTRERGGLPRLACPDEGCGFVLWDNPKPVVAGIVERAGRVILVRSRGWPETYFGLVAGFLETGETPEEAVLREIEEETGLGAVAQHYVGTYPFERRNQIIFVYHVVAEDGPIRLCDEELDAYKAVPIRKLRPWPAGTGPALRDWLAARGHYPPTVEFGAAIYD